MVATPTRENRDQKGGRHARRGRLATIAIIAAAALLVVIAAAVVARLAGVSLPNPFAETHTENPNAVVVAELKNQSRYVAASGRYQTLIDSQEDAAFLPDALKGSRELFVAEGDVDGWVDFSRLTTDAVQVSPDGKTLTVHVPPAQLGRPAIDTGATRLVSRERGLLDRLGDALGNGDPTDQQALYQRAEQKIADAAARSELSHRTEENTATFLRSLFGGLGYTDVKVVFDGPTAGQR